MINYKWLRDELYINSLVDMFVANTTTDYITHIEIEEGRATDQNTWSEDLKRVLWMQFYIAIKAGNVAVAIDDEYELYGFAVVKWLCKEDDNEDAVVIEDIVSAEKGIGTELVRFIEEEVRAAGPIHDRKYSMRADVSPKNTRANRFMEKLGYKPMTIVYTKEIN